MQASRGVSKKKWAPREASRRPLIIRETTFIQRKQVLYRKLINLLIEVYASCPKETNVGNKRAARYIKDICRMDLLDAYDQF